MESIKKNSYYVVKFNGKFVNNYAWREASNSALFVLGEEMVQTWGGYQILNFGWNTIKGMTFEKV